MTAHFTYSVVNQSGQRVTGEIRCQDRHEALRQLVARGYHPLAVWPIAPGVLGRMGRFGRRVSSAKLSVFTRQLAALLKAGLPLVEALRTLRRQTEDRRLCVVIEDVEQALTHDGGQLADAMEAHPRVFSPVYTNLVRVGEETGNLVDVLGGLAEYLSDSARLRGQVIGAFVYPIFLLLMGVVAVGVLMTFVIPKFQQLFRSFGQNLPWPTRALMSTSAFMSEYWPFVLLGLLATVLLVSGALRREAVRRRLHAAMLRLPVVGKMLIKLEVARLARTLSALVAAGVKILGALRITGNVCRNLAVRATFPRIIELVAAGELLAKAVEQAGVFPPMMVKLIATAESTGQLPEMLRELAKLYEEESERAVMATVRLLEPLLILVMGGFVACIVAAIMLPVLNANTMVGQ